MVALPLSAAATSAAGGNWAGVATSKCGPPSSIAASSVTGASKAERLGGGAGGWGAFPSPACSITTFLDHSMHEVASSAGGDGPTQEMVDSNGKRDVHPAVGLADAATAPKAATAGGRGGGGGQPEALLCTAPGPLQALHQGDVLVLRGNMAEALQHYPGAHVYGFLPVFLVRHWVPSVRSVSVLPLRISTMYATLVPGTQRIQLQPCRITATVFSTAFRVLFCRRDLFICEVLYCLM